MKKRIGKINSDAIVFSNADKNAEELLELFLQEKIAFNLSDETISLYHYIRRYGQLERSAHQIQQTAAFRCQSQYWFENGNESKRQLAAGHNKKT